MNTNSMKTSMKGSLAQHTVVRFWAACFVAGVLLTTTSTRLMAAEPTPQALDVAINTGDLARYFADITTWLGEKIPVDSSAVSEASLRGLLEDPAFANTLAQRQVLAKLGVLKVDAFAKADLKNKAFLAWLLRNTPAMEMYLEAATPTGLRAREANQWSLPVRSLELWSSIYHADPDSREGLYLKLAIATALAPPGTGSPGAGQAKTQVDPLARYQHFKEAHKNKELFPSFDHLTPWELTKVVQSGASNEDLTWGRKMINTWRPDLRVNEMVVNSTSEVWRRNSPISFDNTYKNVLTGGGKCGPRSSWSVFICQAFGIPAIGVGQPAHACVAWKAVNPMVDPQPGSAWKVGYGRGWGASKLDGLSGPEFLEGTEARAKATQFSQVEQLRWLASALASPDQVGSVKKIAQQIAEAKPAAKPDLNASLKPEEAEADPGVHAPKKKPAPSVQTTSAPAPAAIEPAKPVDGIIRLPAASFAKMGGEVSYGGLQIAGVRVQDSYPEGKQIYFQSNMKSAWTDYHIDIPAAGTYTLTLTTAAANTEQKFEISSDGRPLATVAVPMSTGLWTTTPKVELKLEPGVQTLRISAPFQRGVAVKQLELTAAGQGG